MRMKSSRKKTMKGEIEKNQIKKYLIFYKQQLKKQGPNLTK